MGSRMGLIARQAFRRYASAAPTAAFAGQKGANVSRHTRTVPNGCYMNVG